MQLLRRSLLAGVWMAAAALAGTALAGTAMAQSASDRAVEAAKKYAGQTITIVWEAGLQSLDPLNFSGPKWEKLTGMKIKVIEVPTAEMFTKILQEHRSGSGAYDALNVIPSWMPDLVTTGALEPLDSWVDKFDYRKDLQDISPMFRDNWMKVNGKIYGFPDDGDCFIMYYRKDIFADPALREAFKAKYNREMDVPKTWADFAEVGSFITEKMAPKVYGAAFFRDAPYAQFMFQERFRNEGGKFFDANTMKATVNSDIGVKTLAGMRAENKFMPPGVETWGFVENLAAFATGQTAMTISWPPYGRWTAGYGTDDKVMSWVPKTQIAGKVGYALPPGGHPELAAGFSLSVSADSKNKEAAYLFIQWLNSPEISTERVQIPYTLRDPFRDNHYTDPYYLSRWPDAKYYLETLKQAATYGLLDLSIIQTDKYEEALRQGISRLWAGDDPKAIADKIAAQWDAITQKVGVDKQKAAYADWAGKSAAYPH